MAPAKFGDSTTAEEAAALFAASSITDKVVIVTGASLGGLGAETARVVAKHSPKLLIIAGRSQEKLDETEEFIKKESPDAKTHKLMIVLASLESVRKAAAEVVALKLPVDVLINNAAIMACPYTTTADGFESQLGVNHLGPFLFTNLLRSQILASPHPRVVNVSSKGHTITDILYEDPGFSGGKKYNLWAAYGQSKTANILFAVALKKRWGVEAFALHPGMITTNLSRHITLEERVKMGFCKPDGTPIDNPGSKRKSLGEGASTTIVAAFDPTIAPLAVSYLSDAQIANQDAKPYALDEANAERLWALSEMMIGETFA
ncbi:hypothetical protein P7C70_g5322, partial [Phenoliferia sp. Uapishka_3]